MKNKYKCAVLQNKLNDFSAVNLDKLDNLIAESKQKEDFDLLCLQELFALPYFCREINEKNFSLAENLDSKNNQKIQSIAAKYNIVLIRPFFEEVMNGVYTNSCVVFDRDGRRAGVYRKMHIPDDPYFYEKFYFSPGDNNYEPVETSIGKIGILICWDQWFPEPARILALKGAEIIFYPTAIGYLKDEEKQKDKFCCAWKTVQRAHAIANNIYIAAVNRSGIEGQTTFWGNSFAVSPEGEEILTFSEKKTAIKTFIVNKNLIRDTRITWPFLRDRRVESYSDIALKYYTGK